jgi:hypothetical protein
MDTRASTTHRTRLRAILAMALAIGSGAVSGTAAQAAEAIPMPVVQQAAATHPMPVSKPNAERAPTRNMAERLRDEMLDDLMGWAVRLTGLPPSADRPDVIALPPADLAATVCPDAPSSCRGLVAVYDTERIRVLVRDTLDLRELSAQSFIVHEFIHHLQHRAQGAGLLSACEQVMVAERQAYEAQNRFLRQHRQLLRVGEMLRGMRCDRDDAQEPTVQPVSSMGSLSANAPLPAAAP